MSRSNTAAALSNQSAESKSGVVKWFKPDRGYGFIILDEGGPEIFIHVSVCKKHSLPDGVREGERVLITTEDSRKQPGKLMASSIKVV